MFLGFAGQGYKLDENMKMNPGQTGKIGSFTIRHDALTVTNDDQKQMITGHVTVLRGDKEIAQLQPARWFFAKHEEQPTTEVAIRRAAGEDLYVVLAGYEVQTQNATYAVTINPLVNWIWFGFAVLAFGTGHRDAARARIRVRRRQGARGSGDDDAVAAADPAAGARRGARADRSSRAASCEAARSGHHVHVRRLPRAHGQLPDAAELPRPERAEREAGRFLARA